AFGHPEWAVLAKRAADFVLRELFEGGVLWRSFRDGVRRVEGRIEDYGALAEGLIELYMATFEPAYLESAAQLAEAALDLFWDEDAGGFLSAPEGEGLIAAVYALTDEAAPSGASSLSHALVRLTGL
ncbi:MAG TPA: thioredoxin domain-containing protein, partial [Myxococcales bacterium]|nr:thioredoxin domain-containing protein [Myxococcales bacterium]